LTEDKLKIMVLADSRSFHTERYVNQLENEGCQVLLASIEKGPIKYKQISTRGPRFLSYPLGVPAVEEMIEDFKPDIINPHFASGYGYLVSLIDTPCPVVLHLWGSDILIVPKKTFLHKMKTARALKAADLVIGDSEYLLRAADKIAHIDNSSVIPWGLEQRFIDQFEKDKAIASPIKIIVPRSHEEVYKNITIVRQLAEFIIEGKIEVTFPDFGSLFPDFKKEAKTLVGDKLSYYSRLDRDDFMELISDHDVYLSASRSDSSPASLIEAMGLGLIPVTADIKGVREWLTNDNGFLFDQTKEDGLKGVMYKLFENINDFNLIRQKNYEQVAKVAIFEKNIDQTISLMRKLVEKKN